MDKSAGWLGRGGRLGIGGQAVKRNGSRGRERGLIFGGGMEVG